VLDKEKTKKEIQILVDKYKRIVDSGEIKEYGEENTKKDFILPLFEALGWDVYNKLENEVTAEKRVSNGRVDYAFRISEIPKFFLEAKSFKENIDDRRWIDQAINYSWLKGVTWAVLTNFKKIKVFNSEIKATMPVLTQFFELDCENFVDNIEKLLLLSRDSLDSGVLDEKAEEWGKKMPKKPIDERLFSDLTKARELLSTNILENNKDKHLSEEELEESVQKIISRLIFVRTLEDRKYEEPILLSIVREKHKKGVAIALKEIFEKLNEVYDARLFAHHLIDDLKIDPNPLRIIIEGLYESEEQIQKYDFAAIDADILGGIYEQYLSYVLKSSKKGVKLNGNTKHKKEEGIFYTPKFIVEYIIKEIFKELNNQKFDLRKLTVLDPSCGSGSFLIKVYDNLHDKILEQKVLTEGKEDDGTTALNYEEKVGIVQNSIFGVDLDPKAVEIAKLNLFLKVAEKKHLLPTLIEKIKCGNSVINDTKIDSAHSFDWKNEFSEIISNGGFDIIVGNPPYIKLHTLGKTQSDYFYETYESATKHFDIYTLFVEKALSLLNENGILGFIVPSKFLNADYGEGLRKIIGENKYLFKLVNFKDFQVFEGASTYTCLLFLKKTKNEKFDYFEVTNKNKLERTKALSADILQHATLEHPLGDTPWNFSIGDVKNVIDKLEKIELRLENISDDVFAGLQTGRDKFFCVEMIKDEGDLVKIRNGVDQNEQVIEKRILKKLLKGKEIRRWNIDWHNVYVIYPYEDVDGTTTLIPPAQLKSRYPKAYQYFTHYKKDLLVTSSSEVLDESNWYRHRRARSIGQFEHRKILTQVLANRGAFSLDENGEFYLVGGGTAGGFAIILNEKYEDYLYAILALLNSKIIEFYLKNTSTPFQRGYFAYGGKFMKKFPIILPDNQEFDTLSELTKKQINSVKRLSEIGKKITEEREKILKEINETEDNIDELIFKIYGITESEKKTIEDFIK